MKDIFSVVLVFLVFVLRGLDRGKGFRSFSLDMQRENLILI
jgi:hypothetical protein